MLKKIVLIAASLALLVSIAGCACTTTAAPTPTPTMQPTAAATPMAEMTPEMEPSPDMGTTPGGADGEAGAAVTPGANGTQAGTIQDFKEGKEVKQEEAPQVMAAIKEKYENATVKSIKHATYESRQVYEVELTSGTVTKTVYVQPDGTIIEK